MVRICIPKYLPRVKQEYYYWSLSNRNLEKKFSVRGVVCSFLNAKAISFLASTKFVGTGFASKLADFSSAADETSENTQEWVHCHAVKGF